MMDSLEDRVRAVARVETRAVVSGVTLNHWRSTATASGTRRDYAESLAVQSDRQWHPATASGTRRCTADAVSLCPGLVCGCPCGASEDEWSTQMKMRGRCVRQNAGSPHSGRVAQVATLGDLGAAGTGGFGEGDARRRTSSSCATPGATGEGFDSPVRGGARAEGSHFQALLTRNHWRSKATASGTRRAGWRQPPDRAAGRRGPGADAARLACVRAGGRQHPDASASGPVRVLTHSGSPGG